MLMVAPVIIAAGIAAAASLASQQQASSAAGSATKQGRQFSLDMYRRQLADQRVDYETQQRETRDLMQLGDEYTIRSEERALDRENTTFQRQVADAQAAGLHPLFAMGTGGGGFTPSVTQIPHTPGMGSPGVPGYPGGGSYAGEGIAQAGAAIARGINAREAGKVAKMKAALGAEMHEAQIRRLNSQADLDDMYALAKQSEMKRAEAALIASPSLAADMTRPPEKEARRHRVVNLPFLGRVRVKERMTAGGATEQTGEISDWLYGADLVRRAIIQKIQKSGWTRERAKRKMLRKLYKQSGEENPDDFYLGGG